LDINFFYSDLAGCNLYFRLCVRRCNKGSLAVPGLEWFLVGSSTTIKFTPVSGVLPWGVGYSRQD
jgi:hypothetical protein